MDDCRFWSSVANVARQRGRVRLYKALRTGKLRAYIRVDEHSELRVVDTGYWFDPEHTFVELPALLAPHPQAGIEVPSVVTGRNVPPECLGEPIFVLADDLAALMPAPAEQPEEGGAPRPTPVKASAVAAWVRHMINKGCTGRDVEKERETAFPGKIPPSKRKVAGLYREMHDEDFGDLPKTGKIHPLLLRRRTPS